ncbi:MAG: heme-degrading domain-containing protein [Spirochaetaceae bacterium]
MKNYDNILKKLDKEHNDLQFQSFSNKTALTIGLRLLEIAEEKNLVLTIDITRHNQQLFHYACEGTSKDNDEWIKRKNSVTNHFSKSSFYIKNLLEQNNTTIDQMFYLNQEEYSAFGGSFPIIIKDSGVIGTITVSGLPDEEDHNLVVSTIKDYIYCL